MANGATHADSGTPTSGAREPSPERSAPTGLPPAGPPPVAWGWLLPAMAALAVVLTVVSEWYGFERDELYFRMLQPAWGYVDQPPLTPLLGRLAAHVSADPWAQRVPATLCAVFSVLVVVLITRELGGGRAAQGLCAWSYAFAASPLLMGHVLLTTSLDLVVWPLVCLFLIRAVLRGPRWWLAVGATVGLSTYNKLLIVLLLVALAAGLLIVGPRRVLWTGWLALAVVLALLIALPNLLYQAAHAWPQLTMSRALSRNNASSVRIVMWPYLLLLLGPPLVPIWVVGLVTPWRRRWRTTGLGRGAAPPAPSPTGRTTGLGRGAASDAPSQTGRTWRGMRFLPVAFAVLLVETFAGGGQLYYPLGLLAVVYAAGCVPFAEFLSRGVGRWRTATVVVICNGVICALIGLPLIPVSVLADTPVPDVNQLARDQVGWPDYVSQVAAAYRTVPAPDRSSTVIVTSNYGEAGAIARYGPRLGLPTPYSGQNQLYFDRRPPDTTTVAVIVGGQYPRVSGDFASCAVVARLTNRYGVDNEEEGEPVAVCRQPERSWAALWPAFQHYD